MLLRHARGVALRGRGLMSGPGHALSNSFSRASRQSISVSGGSLAMFHGGRTLAASVLCSDPIDPICKEILSSYGHEVHEKVFPSVDQLKAEIGNYDALIVRSGTKVTADVISAGKKLRVVGRAGTGTDNIDLNAATRSGVLVLNTPGGNSRSAGEMTMALIASLARHIPQADATMKAGQWERKSFMGSQLSQKTIGVIGLGRIGRDVASWCQAFGMTTIGYDPILSPAASKAANIEPVTLDELFRRSDIITLHVPLSNETRNLIDANAISKCKKGVHIINCARGGTVDEKALLEGLKNGQVGGAGLDVFSQEPPTEDMYELIEHPKVIATPHLGASTEDAQHRVAVAIAKDVAQALSGNALNGLVNAPDVSAARELGLTRYLRLAEQLGSIQAQLLRGAKLSSIKIVAEGDRITSPEISELLRCSVLTGVLRELVEGELPNLVNANAIAEEMGLAVSFERLSAPISVESRLTVVFETEQGTKKISGTAYGAGKGELRLTGIGDYEVDCTLDEDMVFFKNMDKPGVLAKVTSVLSSLNINIGSCALGRRKNGDRAQTILTVDEAPTETVAALEALGMLEDVQLAHLRPPTDYGENQISGGAQQQEETSQTPKPTVRPRNPQFGSGPCKKRPGYSLAKLSAETLGRSHRSAVGKAQLAEAINLSRQVLGIPDDYLLGIVPASDTGAFEMAMWSMLGQRPVDVCHWESFGKGWYSDITQQLRLQEKVAVRSFTADYGHLPNLTETNPDHDIIFTWNGTTSGVKVPNGDWIADDRTGLTFNDATSAAFAMDIPWHKVDVTTYSWQKVLGGEGGHGVIVLSPRAVERLETYTPEWPMPKIFRMVKKGKLDRAIFKGSTINTPSLLCVADYIDALQWAQREGGVPGLVRRSQRNMHVIENLVSNHSWLSFLAEDPEVRSNTSVCLKVDLEPEKVKEMTKLLEAEGVAFDIGSYRDAPSGLRIWCGATVETDDLEALGVWLEWAYNEVTFGDSNGAENEPQTGTFH